jgi:hypothetical protein
VHALPNRWHLLPLPPPRNPAVHNSYATKEVNISWQFLQESKQNTRIEVFCTINYLLLETGIQNQTTLDYLIAHQNHILGFPAIHRIKIRQRYDYQVDNSTARFIQIVHFDHSREQASNFILEGPLVKWPSTKGCVSRVLQISVVEKTICTN